MTNTAPSFTGPLNCFSLNLADLVVSAASREPDLKLQVEGATRHFLVEGRTSDVELQVVWDDLSHGDFGEKIFDSGAVWQLYRQNGSYNFCFRSPAVGDTPFKLARFDHNFRSGEIRLHRPYFSPGQSVDPLEYPLDELLINHLLPQKRGAEIHGLGLVDPGGRGRLFVGQSGAGKSTLARFWAGREGVQILSDDRIILRQMGGDIWMFGTPWHGEARHALPEKARLAGLYFLHHGLKNKLVPLPKAETVSRLFACSFPPFYNREAVDATLSFLNLSADFVPGWELSFVPDQGVVDFIRKQGFEGSMVPGFERKG